MIIPFSVSCYNPRTLPLPLPEPPLLPVAFFSYPLPVNREPLLGGGGSELPKVRTSHRPGSGGGGGYLPPESLLCNARGGARSGPGGCCVSSPSPSHTPTGHPMDPDALRKEILYKLGSGVVGGVSN